PHKSRSGDSASLHHRLCMMSSLRDYRKNTKRQRTNAKRRDTYKYQCVFRPRCRLAPTQPPGGRLPTLRLPTRLDVPFKLFWFYYTQRRAGRPRSSPRRFAAIVGVADTFHASFGTRASLAPTSASLAPTITHKKFLHSHKKFYHSRTKNFSIRTKFFTTRVKKFPVLGFVLDSLGEGVTILTVLVWGCVGKGKIKLKMTRTHLFFCPAHSFFCPTHSFFCPAHSFFCPAHLFFCLAHLFFCLICGDSIFVLSGWRQLFICFGDSLSPFGCCIVCFPQLSVCRDGG
ncbi:MAG: hypothetical protein LBQ66_14680, partial [Planctomycetaceae bacterium]|nr:hypothetical protein [Planctomycetaceae bacterium]